MRFRARVRGCLGLLASVTAAGLAQQAQDNEPPKRRDTIVVTGTYQPVPLEEVDRSVRVFETTGDARLLANTTADFLKLDPSIDLRQRAPNQVQADLSIRGSTFGQTLVLVDGMRLNDVQSGHHNMDIPLALESLDRIEVLKGSGSTLYGSDAVGGVVNFVTRVPENSELRMRAAAGSFGTTHLAGLAAFARPKFTQQVTFSRDFSTGFRENRDYRNLSLTSGTSFQWRPGAGGITLAHADRPFGADLFYGPFDSWERTKTWFASGRQAVGERTLFSFAYRRHTDLFVLRRYRPQDFTNRHAAEHYQGVFRRWEPIAANTTLHYGVEGLHESIESNNLGSHSRGRGAGYIALDVRALKRFSFTVGAREEIYGSSESQFSPSAAAGVWLSPHLKLRGSASRAFRLPTFTDLYYHDPANRGSPDLRPESAWSYEAGVDFNVARLSGEAVVFHRRESDGIDYIRSGPDQIWHAANIHRLRFTGLEAALAVAAGQRHRLEARYTRLHGATDGLAGVVSRYVFNYPEHSGICTWQGMLWSKLAARSRLGALVRPGRNAYAVWDVYVAGDVRGVRPFLQLTNLTGAVYDEIPGVVMPGRAFLGGVEVALTAKRR